MKKVSGSRKQKSQPSTAKPGTAKIRVVIAGVGNVGRRLLELLERKRLLLRERHELEFVLVGISDSGGARMATRGFDLLELIDTKMRGEKVGSHNLGSLEVLQTAQADLFVDLTPTNLKTGEPGLSLIRHALKERMNVVTANKGPLVLAYSELMSLARKHNAKLHFSATVTGGLPTLNIGVRDLAPSEITGFEGIVNATTNYILTRMNEGDSFEAALKHAQDVGHAEADPSLDVDGWDAANKLVIIANSVLRHPTKLGDVQIVGIRGITQRKMREANQAGKVIKLVAKGEKLASGDWKFSVKPLHLPAEHPLARVDENMMGVIYHTDINGTIMATIEERDPYPTAAAVLRDMVAVYH